MWGDRREEPSLGKGKTCTPQRREGREGKALLRKTQKQFYQNVVLVKARPTNCHKPEHKEKPVVLPIFYVQFAVFRCGDSGKIAFIF
jgi:hypothetical protein